MIELRIRQSGGRVDGVVQLPSAAHARAWLTQRQRDGADALDAVFVCRECGLDVHVANLSRLDAVVAECERKHG